MAPHLSPWNPSKPPSWYGPMSLCRTCSAMKKADTEPLIDSLRSLRGVRVACMLREQDGKVRGSLRAKDDTDVASLARELGGGGHRAAAGLTLDMPLDAARSIMADKLVALISPAEGV